MEEYPGDAATAARRKRIRGRTEHGSLSPAFASGGRTQIYLTPTPQTWSQALSIAHEDGLLTLPNMPRGDLDTIIAEKFGMDWTPHFWDALTGRPEAVLPASRGVLEAVTLPDGWTSESLATPSDAEIGEFQRLNRSCGVAPNPAYMMRGETCGVTNTLIRDGFGTLVAAAWAATFFPQDSRLGGTAFVGLVSVAEQARGLGLGKYANARVLVDSHAALGWTGATEFVAADNAASRAMVLSCGLNHDAGLVTCVLVRGEGYFTR